ncbi:perforin-1, partial [Colius striatus]|uniref:perforin-1 n=1 Tax=Colius striatus TaxID=57412 RepID=UPI002B1D70D7
RATGSSCSVPTVPGTDPLGWGMDITTLSLSPGQVLLLQAPSSITPQTTCTLCLNPLSPGQPPKLLPHGVGSWRVGRRCRQGQSAASGSRALGVVVAGGEETAKGWRVGFGGSLGKVSGGLALAGSHSRAAEFGLEKQREDRYSFAALSVACVHYWSSLSRLARPSPHFLQALRTLLRHFGPDTAPDYQELLSTYGTHFVSSARAGGRLRSLAAIRSCRAAMAGSSTQEVADCLGVEVSAGGGVGRAGAMAEACRKARESNQANISFNELYGERLVEVEGGHQDGDLLYGRPEAYKKWLRSLPATPALVDADVRPLHTLLPPQSPRREALKAAISHYITHRALKLNCSRHCRAGNHLIGPCECGCANNALSTPQCCSHRSGLATMKVWVVSGEGWWWGDHVTATDAYVRVAFGSHQLRTQTVWNNQRPKWGSKMDLGVVEMIPGTTLKMEVWDEDNKWDDDLLGACEVTVVAGGYQDGVCFPGGGRLVFGYQVTCGPALGGPTCHDYVPQTPQGEGGQLDRDSQWPPEPWEWHKEEEEEEEEGPDGNWGASVATNMGLEPTVAFGELPEPWGGFEERPEGRDPPREDEEEEGLDGYRGASVATNMGLEPTDAFGELLEPWRGIEEESQGKDTQKAEEEGPKGSWGASVATKVGLGGHLEPTDAFGEPWGGSGEEFQGKDPQDGCGEGSLGP